MAFDFNEINEEPETFGSDLKKLISCEFHKVTDIPELKAKVAETTVRKSGFWQADRYFTMQLNEVLKSQNFDPYNKKLELIGGTFVGDDSNGLLGMLGNALAFCFGFNEDLEKPVKLTGFKEEASVLMASWLENMPILVFQQYEGPIEVTCYDVTFVLDQEEYQCRRDAVVFRGVYKAHPADGNKYRLERIFDKYYFGIPQKADGNSAIDVKFKTA